MNPKRLEKFANKWFSEWEACPPVHGRASVILTKLIEDRPDDAWERILALVAKAKDQALLELIGAGPLEDLFRCHGPAIIGRAETMAADDARFATSLGNVWGWTSIDSPVLTRIKQIGNTR
jgi:hypothetical protein